MTINARNLLKPRHTAEPAPERATPIDPLESEVAAVPYAIP
jgi:hypothetical protein